MLSDKRSDYIIASGFFTFTVGKICDKPLLHNANAFPDSVFSGSGDSSHNYKDARITGNGWCPSGSGSVYLLLDLQKEYHITRVVVMADKEQTNWSSSYSLKYSRDTSFKNSVQVSFYDCNEVFPRPRQVGQKLALKFKLQPIYFKSVEEFTPVDPCK